MPFDGYVTSDLYGIDHAHRPWNGVGAIDSGSAPQKVHTNDPQDQIDRCLTCPMPTDKMCGKKCWYRQGKEPPERSQAPRGYDRDALDSAMVHACTDQQIADALGISLYQVKKWLEWRYR